ncbi:MAG: hypothetical protein ACE5MK_09540 [Acidobacteriota bacterium]
MTLVKRHPLVIWLSIMLLIGQVGCGHDPAPAPVPPPSERIRSQLGTIGVVSGRFTPEGPDKPKFYGGGSEVEVWGGGWVWVPAEAALFVLVVAGIVYLVREMTEEDEGLYSTWPQSAHHKGGISMLGPPTGARTLTEEELASILVHQVLRDRILQIAQERTSHHFVPLKDPAPTDPYERVNYESLKGKGIDTVIEISVPMLGFMEYPDDLGRPDAMLVMTAHARLIRVADGEELYANTWEYGGMSHSTTQLTAKDAKLVRDELNDAFQTLAQWIANDLFLNQ